MTQLLGFTEIERDENKVTFEIYGELSGTVDCRICENGKLEVNDYMLKGWDYSYQDLNDDMIDQIYIKMGNKICTMVDLCIYMELVIDGYRTDSVNLMEVN